MKPAFIKAELEDKGVRAARIAERMGCTKTNVSEVIKGIRKSRRVATEISRVIGLPLDTVFPGQYPVARVTRHIGCWPRRPIKRVSRSAGR